MTKFGYLVPEFPGQTHIFFWRELEALEQLGVMPDLVSTRLPHARLVAHSWSAAAITRTTYLVDARLAAVMQVVVGLALGFPGGWLRCLASIGRASVPGLMGRVRLLGLVLVGARLAGLARQRGWSHVHVHSCADSANIALFANRLSGLPYSFTLHGPLDDYGPNQREKWRHARFALVITKQLMDETANRLRGFLPPRVEIAPMGVSLDSFVRTLPYEPWSGTGRLRIFTCGRLNPGKGHADLIDAVGRLRSAGIDATLAIAGEDDAGGQGYRLVLEEKLRGLDCGGAVTLLGAVSEAVVRAQLERAHVFALASLAEPLGVAIMEAMAMQLPVVVTGAGGVAELVDDGVDGLLVRPSHVDELVDRLAAVAGDPALARRLGEAGRAKVERGFGSTRSAAMLIDLLGDAARPIAAPQRGGAGLDLIQSVSAR